MRNSILCVLAMMCTSAAAYEPGEFFLDPSLAVGYNVAQGTNVLVGLDAGYALSGQLAAGVGAHYSFGERPEHDRAMGAGPFVTFFQPLTSFLVASVREDIAYLDQRNPVRVVSAAGESWTHTNEHGVASITSLALHLSITSNFGISAGYRAMLALSNTDIARDRSGTFLGISIGI